MNTLTETLDQKKELTMNTIQDAVIFDRLCGGIMRALNGNNEWCEVQETYKGVNGIIETLTFEAGSIIPDRMHDIFSSNSCNTTIDPKTAASNIYSSWEQLLQTSKA